MHLLLFCLINKFRYTVVKYRYSTAKVKLVVTLFIHDCGYSNDMGFVIHGVKDNIIVDWHLPKTTAAPWFFSYFLYRSGI